MCFVSYLLHLRTGSNEIPKQVILRHRHHRPLTIMMRHVHAYHSHQYVLAKAERKPNAGREYGYIEADHRKESFHVVIWNNIVFGWS